MRLILTEQQKIEVEQMLSQYAALTQNALSERSVYCRGLHDLSQDSTLKTLWESEQYSLMAGGKRIRPALVLESCRMLGGEERCALPLACAIEMIHTYSLIHDDLPSMDNDDLRRGKPTNHKVFGEAIATLAGDGLLTDAFTLISQSESLTAEQKVQAISMLSTAAGSTGMIGGQVIDLESENQPLSLDHLRLLHARKTGALFRASLLLGATAAGLIMKNDAVVFDALRVYAENIGLAFQVLDDILDVTADPALLGKTKGKDMAENKNTFLKYYTLPQAHALAAELTERAIKAIQSACPDSERLCILALYLQQRVY